MWCLSLLDFSHQICISCTQICYFRRAKSWITHDKMCLYLLLGVLPTHTHDFQTQIKQRFARRMLRASKPAALLSKTPKYEFSLRKFQNCSLSKCDRRCSQKLFHNSIVCNPWLITMWISVWKSLWIESILRVLMLAKPPQRSPEANLVRDKSLESHEFTLNCSLNMYYESRKQLAVAEITSRLPQNTQDRRPRRPSHDMSKNPNKEHIRARLRWNSL